jgi:ABC-2 type transport system ATP-binding protein
LIDQVQISDAGTFPQSGVVARGVTRQFGKVWAVKGMDLDVPYGRVTALVGPNGAGKTTLMLMLATLLKPTAGQLHVAGYDPTVDPKAVRAATGWMPDTLGMYDQLKVHEYLDFFADAHALPRDAKAKEVPALLAAVRLSEYGDAPVHVLSRGQKQRLALARALIHRPRVLLLDEPASGLDPRSRIELRDLLRDLASRGVAILVSSHILAELSEMADRAVFVSAGRVVASHEMSELANLGASSLVAWRVRARDPQALSAALADMGVAVVGGNGVAEGAANGAATGAANGTAHGTAHTPLDNGGGVELPPMTEEKASELLADLVGRGVRVVAFGPVGTALESAYLALTEERR